MNINNRRLGELIAWEPGPSALGITSCTQEEWRGMARELLRLRAELEAARRDAWQPIETAPKCRSDAGKDREYVLVVYPGDNGPFVMMAYQDSLGWDAGVWRLHEQPTHWMPLPAPPTAIQESKP